MVFRCGWGGVGSCRLWRIGWYLQWSEHHFLPHRYDLPPHGCSSAVQRHAGNQKPTHVHTTVSFTSSFSRKEFLWVWFSLSLRINLKAGVFFKLVAWWLCGRVECYSVHLQFVFYYMFLYGFELIMAIVVSYL